VRDLPGTTRRSRSRAREVSLAEPPASADLSLPALGVRRPWAELILRGLKTIEVRVVPTNIRGTIYLYASKNPGVGSIVKRAATRHGLDVGDLPRGLLIGTVEIVGCRPCSPSDSAAACVPSDVLRNSFGWILANPRRLKEPLQPRFLPFGIWFYPFEGRNGAKQSHSAAKPQSKIVDGAK